MRRWSMRNAEWLYLFYEGLERVMVRLLPLFERLGIERSDRAVEWVESIVKGFLFDSQSCGQCTLGSTGMVCPMNCPKTLRNGPCGGVRANGNCEVKPEMPCVWVMAWEGSQQIPGGVDAIRVVQGAIDTSLRGHSSWLHAARERRDAVVETVRVL